MHLKGHISYCVQISEGFLLNFTTLCLKSSYITAPWGAIHRHPLSILSPHTSLNRIQIILTLPLWDMAAIFFSLLRASGVCDIWVICHEVANVWLISHPCNKRLCMCSRGPRNTFTRNKASALLGNLSKKELSVLWCSYLDSHLTTKPHLLCMLRVQNSDKEWRTKRKETNFCYYFSAPIVISYLRTPPPLPFTVSSYECQNVEG